MAARPRRSRSPLAVVWIAVLAFALGAALVGVLAWRGTFAGFMPREQAAATAPQPAATEAVEAQSADKMGSVETRLALLEDRLSRIDYQADAASGNAARAEGLLIAFAARRMVDRGEPLSYVADQLRLRFADAQPRAVQTIIDFAQRPVTIDELSARLEALSPGLTDSENSAGAWDRIRRELSSLFVVHRDSSSLSSPQARIDRARLMLSARRIGQAIDEVRRLPNAYTADTWIADAERFRDVQKALDLIETTAMLEPHRLQDSNGQRVEQPSPLATPGPEPESGSGQSPQPGTGTAPATPPAPASPAPRQPGVAPAT